MERRRDSDDVEDNGTDWRAGSGGAGVEIVGLVKRFGNVEAVRGLDLSVKSGEFLTLLGASGSGKTTTLNVIAGFLHPDAGEVNVDGADISHLPPHKRNIGMVFQDYLLFPHITVEDNVAFPLKRRKVGKTERKRLVGEALEKVGLSAFGDRLPRQLSGGQQQRVALARALVFAPRLLLMDEPLGALDRNLREQLQLEIRRMHEEAGSTCIYVTHDQQEALVLSDRIAVFRDGGIEQVASPIEIYERPATSYVADFIGDSNILRGDVGRDGDAATITIGGSTLRMPRGEVVASPRAALVIRPERLRLGDHADGENRLNGEVAEVVYLGSEVKILVDIAGVGRVIVREHSPSRVRVVAGDLVSVTWSADDATVVPAE